MSTPNEECNQYKIPLNSQLERLKKLVMKWIDAVDDEIVVEQKTIGRHEGFILVRKLSSQTVEQRYFSKLERVNSRVVFIYNFLKRIGLGPHELHLCTVRPTAKSADWKLGITTIGMDGFRMAYNGASSAPAKDVTPPSVKVELLRKLDAFAMFFVTNLCGIDNIPYNKENWGMYHNAGTQNIERFCIVDFHLGSSDRYLTGPFWHRELFENCWRPYYVDKICPLFPAAATEATTEEVEAGEEAVQENVFQSLFLSNVPPPTIPTDAEIQTEFPWLSSLGKLQAFLKEVEEVTLEWVFHDDQDEWRNSVEPDDTVDNTEKFNLMIRRIGVAAEFFFEWFGKPVVPKSTEDKQ